MLVDFKLFFVQLNLDERQPSRVVRALQASQQDDEAVLASLRQAGRQDIVDILQPNNVVSTRGAEAAAVSMPTQSTSK